MPKGRILFLLAALFSAVGSSAQGDREECEAAVHKYNSALNDVADRIKRYVSCVDDSKGHDDCSTEFRRLKSAQDDFESAVSGYQADCQ